MLEKYKPTEAEIRKAKEIMEAEGLEEKRFTRENIENKIERRFLQVVRPLDILKKGGLRPLESLQDLEQGEISPENFIGTNLRALENPDCPNALLMMPHSGEYTPKNLYDRLTEEGRKGVAKLDAGTYAIGQSEKIPSIWPKISRIGGFDLNRAPLDLRDNSGKAPGSLIWKETMSGEQLYRDGEEPTSEEAAYLSKEYHERYYKKIEEIVGKLSVRDNDKKQRILIIDLHSYPDPRLDNKDISGIWKKYLDPETLADFKQKSPLFLLSDRSGLSCDSDIKETLVGALQNNFDNYLTEQERLLLLINMPSQNIVDVEKYLPAGGYNAQLANKQREGAFPKLNMLQIEMNESAYVDFVNGYDDACYNYEKLRIMKKLLEKSLLDVDKLLKNKEIYSKKTDL